MKDLHSTEEKYDFSPEVALIFEKTCEREVPNREKEESWANTDIDGKTPFLDVFEELASEPYDIRLASAIVRSWMETKPEIYDGDIVLGVARPKRFLYEHFSWGIQNQSWNQDLRKHPAYKDKVSDIMHRMDALYGPEMQRDGYENKLFPRKEEIFGADTDTSGLMWVGGYQGHTVPSYPLLLSLGIDKAREKVLHYMNEYKGDAEKELLYKAMLIILDGFTAYAEQYAEAAEKAAEEHPEYRQQYLESAANCRAAAHKVPETLGEAAQLMWFYCLWDWCDCVGRFDQYLYPYYEKSLKEDGRAKSENIIGSLWMKLFENGIHNVTLAGVKPDGTDATNELTYLCLQICRRCHKTHPRVSVRFHDNSPADLMPLVVKMWSEGMSDPTVASDNTVIAGLCEYGVPIEDARDYTILGCQEVEIPGKSNFGCEDGMINLAKVLEYALNDGCNRLGQQVGPKSGKFTDFNTIEDVFAAFEAQVKYLVPIWAELTNYGVDIRNANRAKLVKSIFTDSCVERGLNLDAGGSIYNYGVVETAGSSVVADSFAAMEKLVFGEKKISKETLIKAIEANFEGYEKERRMLLSAPKFGNDDDFADKWCRRVLDMFWSEMGKYKSRRGDVFTGACSLLESGIEMGKQTGALPDGRFAGEPLSNTIGPREGTDTSGVTAMLNSVSKLPLKKGVGGTTLNVLLPVGVLSTEEEREKVALVMKEFLKSGGQLAQITTANLDELKDAQVRPECHRDLIVRIGGFSIEFVQLRKEAQDEVISRYSAV